MKKSLLLNGIVLVLVLTILLLASSGICIRPLQQVNSWWLVISWFFICLWIFILIKLKLFLISYRLIILIATIGVIEVLVQTTGGDQSPLVYVVFLLIGVAAWEGKASYGFCVAILFSILEAISFHHENVPENLPLCLHWAAFLVTAIFLTQIVKTRKEKEQLNFRLNSLKDEAEKLAALAEPSSFNLQKDMLLREENRLSARIGTVMDLEESLIRKLKIFQISLPIHTAACFLFTAVGEKHVLRLRAYSSDSDSVAPDVTILMGETLVGLAAKERRKILLDPIAPESAKALPYYLRPHQIKSFLAQPIYISGTSSETKAKEEEELVGVLVLDHLKFNYFSEACLNLVESFSKTLSETIQGSRILHFSRVKTRNLQALNEVSNSFTKNLLDIDKVLQTSVKTAVQMTNSDSAFIALMKGDNTTLEICAWVGPKQEKEKPIQLEEELATWMLENKRPILYTDGKKENTPKTFIKKEGMLGGIKSFLMVPLISGENMLGVIRLNSHKSNAYQEYDKDIITTLANQTAMALENAMMIEQIQEMAIKDGLTGVYNHRYFQEKLSEEIIKAERYNKDLSLILIDVDHFKNFNDSFGHQEGDKVLKIVSDLIQSTVRKKIDTLSRYGGEEFAIIFPEIDGNVAMEMAERIRKKIEVFNFGTNGNVSYRVTVSLGIASYPFDARDQKTLILNADMALYDSKNNGRNCIKHFRKK